MIVLESFYMPSLKATSEISGRRRRWKPIDSANLGSAWIHLDLLFPYHLR